MSIFGSAGDGGAAKMERARQTAVRTGMADIDRKFAGFDPAFYNQAKTDYTKAVTPGMVADYQTTKNNLTYALSRGGQTHSSTAVERDNSLGRELAKNESVIANNAQDVSNQTQARVNQQRGQLVQQVTAGADPAAINSQSTAAVSQIRAPSPVQPLGNLFADWSNMYLNQQANHAASNEESIWSKLGNQGYGQAGGAGGSSYMVEN